ncbi:RNA-guided endonuclease InsQ/TnpB family protein [Synechococcus sp. B60.2]|uniref:RNA-guided endonuclease InsQ/TnpB family protein n=2 Tax=unclassified Synechococcus TaxID=2626047 RepID=UPI0039C3481D
MAQVLTISCKLKVSVSQAAKLEATLDAFARALLAPAGRRPYWVNQSTPEKIVNAVKLQSLCYREIRTRFGLSSNLAQQVCRRRLAAARKIAQQKNRSVKAFKGGFVTYDARIFSFREKDWTVSLTTVEGRERFELAMGNYQRGVLAGTNPKSATLIKRKDGSYYIQIGVEHDPPEPRDTAKAVGVDLGRRDIAHTSEGDHWNGQQLNWVRDHYSRLRAALQRKAGKGPRSTRRRCRELLQRLSGRERRFQAWVNHCISKSIASRALATHSFIALEDLTGIRERVNQQRRSKRERRRANSEAYGPLARGAFYPLRQFVHYKAARAGIQVVVVPPAYSSQTCHRYLWLGQREGKHFRCVNPACGWEGDADLNGANVIALLGVAVNRPPAPLTSPRIRGERGGPVVGLPTAGLPFASAARSA